MADEKTFTQADIDAAIAKAIDEATKGLKDNLTAALDEAKEAKRKLRAASEIKPEDLAALEADNDKLRTDLAAAQKVAKDAATAAEKAAKALETESSFTQKLLIQDGLKSALIANGVKDEDYIDMAVAKFTASASVKVDGDTRTALIGDKPLADAIKEWAATDAGKKIVAAPVNGGGGAGGGKTTDSAAKTITRSEFEAKSPLERLSFAKDGGTVVDQVA